MTTTPEKEAPCSCLIRQNHHDPIQCIHTPEKENDRA